MPCLATCWTASSFGVLALGLASSPILVSYRDIEPAGQRGLLHKMSLQTQADDLMLELLQADVPCLVQGDCLLAGSLPAHSAGAQVVS